MNFLKFWHHIKIEKIDNLVANNNFIKNRWEFISR